MYREPDPRALRAFAQHVGLATALLDQFRHIPDRMGGATTEQLRQLEHEARSAWESLWDQLGQAREVARTLDRDTIAYDAARRAAGDIWTDAANVDIRSEYGGRRTVRWRSAPISPAENAIEALRIAVPEVVVSEPEPQDVELRRAHKRIAEYGPLAIVAAIVTWIVWHFAG